MSKKLLIPGWGFNDDTSLHIGHLPLRKSVCVYVREGSVINVLAYCRNEECAAKLAAYHRKLARGET